MQIQLTEFLRKSRWFALITAFVVFCSSAASLAYFTTRVPVVFSGPLGSWSSPGVLVSFYGKNGAIDKSVDAIAVKARVRLAQPAESKTFPISYVDLNSGAQGLFEFSSSQGELVFETDVTISQGEGRLDIYGLSDGDYSFEVDGLTAYNVLHRYTLSSAAPFNGLGASIASVKFDNKTNYLTEASFQAYSSTPPPTDGTANIIGEISELDQSLSAIPSANVGQVAVSLVKHDSSGAIISETPAMLGADGSYAFTQVDPSVGDEFYIVTFKVDSNALTNYSFVKGIYSQASHITSESENGGIVTGLVAPFKAEANKNHIVDAAIRLKNTITATYIKYDGNSETSDVKTSYAQYGDLFNVNYLDVTDPANKNYVLDETQSTPVANRENVTITSELNITLYYVLQAPAADGTLEIKYYDSDTNGEIASFLNDDIEWGGLPNAPAAGYWPSPHADGGAAVYAVTDEDIDRYEPGYSFDGKITYNDADALTAPGSVTLDETSANVIAIWLKQNYATVYVVHRDENNHGDVTLAEGEQRVTPYSAVWPVGRTFDIAADSAGSIYALPLASPTLSPIWRYSSTDPANGKITVQKYTGPAAASPNAAYHNYVHSTKRVKAEYYNATLRSVSEASTMTPVWTYDAGDMQFDSINAGYTVPASVDSLVPDSALSGFADGSKQWAPRISFVTGQGSDGRTKLFKDSATDEVVIKLFFANISDLQVYHYIKGTTTPVTNVSGQSLPNNGRVDRSEEVGATLNAQALAYPAGINARWKYDSSSAPSVIITDSVNSITLYYTDSSGGNNSGGSGSGGGGSYIVVGDTGTKIEILEDEAVPIDTPFISEHIVYISGYGDGVVKPDNFATRAEIAQMVYSLILDPEKTRDRSSYFSDITGDEWYSKPINYMASEGYLQGYPDGSFKPEDFMTRAEYATFVSQFHGLDETAEHAFPDVPDDFWAAKYINSAYAKNWLSGYPNGAFLPMGRLTRAEAVMTFNHILGRAVGAESFLDIIIRNDFTDLAEEHWAYYAIVEAAYRHTFIYENDIEIWRAQLK
ncbi:MAG: S-layer homology domain-containing protein [Clostridiales bacterium]|jgi:hypothetical protein|nr:S-layer homology domain-containing protein [Clostridiales bacterium]